MRSPYVVDTSTESSMHRLLLAPLKVESSSITASFAPVAAMRVELMITRLAPLTGVDVRLTALRFDALIVTKLPPVSALDVNPTAPAVVAVPVRETP